MCRVPGTPGEAELHTQLGASRDEVAEGPDASPPTLAVKSHARERASLCQMGQSRVFCDVANPQHQVCATAGVSWGMFSGCCVSLAQAVST